MVKNSVFAKNAVQKFNMQRVKKKINNEIANSLKKEFEYKSLMSVPKIEKIVVNTGFGAKISEKTRDEQRKYIDYIVTNLSQICGQRPVLCKAKKSISTFRIREGNVIGAKVTLRGEKMYDFWDRLINIVLPRTRDFKGINRESVDKSGNLNIGVKEHISFPEILAEKASMFFGLEITISTTAKTRKEGIRLFELLDFPFKKV